MSDAPARPDPRAQIAGMVFAVLLIDPDAVIAEVNPAAEDLLGRSARKLLGANLFDAIEITDERVSERMATGDSMLTARGLPIGTPGGARQVNLTMSPLSTHPGWRIVTLSEIGQADMDRGYDETAFAAPSVLAHEIKNPLSAIRGAGQLLVRKLPESERPFALLIAKEVDRIARLVDRMQALGSRSSDPMEEVNLHEIVRAALTVVRSADDRGVQFEEEFDPSLPKVWASPDTLQQVLINLLSNARDACADGDEGGTVTVRTRFVSGLVMNMLRPGRSVRLPIELTVIDNGPGIDPHLGDRVFEPFVTSKKGGQGLGLALVRKLVADMDGRIAYERDRVAELTNFRINLAMAPKEPT
ncbi:two-component system sensor histidine kinase NtrB [Erythrobacter litoralis]|uniref:histidine kinase n=1 Tax=Erythrobacter litoralis (strain HTCC2594) TaxID=314225 RepID=Q2NAE3_ERYLH|nr:ATP-binding protein [Erythrobacter litoralis]ABC63348.1 nitrogen regulatory signal transduction histidine kinase NtrB [Erythrobacter litoralis HTCC2594]